MIPQNPSHDKHLPPLAPGPRAPTPGESVAVPRPKKNSIACQPCKQAKRKVSNVIVSTGKFLTLLRVSNPLGARAFSLTFLPFPVQWAAISVQRLQRQRLGVSFR